ncbi:MAG: hypothetical protein JST58_18990 [Bacteroidetes bacterium]|nr:hypothetical protein [Bacteroidota bacterium]
MARQVGPFFMTGTLRGITYYQMGKVFYARSKSSLSGKRVKEDKAFRKTMENAGLFGRASRIASSVYRLVGRDKKDIRLYRKWTGMALHFLRRGKSIEEARYMLYRKVRRYLGRTEQKMPSTETPISQEQPNVNINGYQAVFLPSIYHPSLDNSSEAFAPDPAFRKKSNCLAEMR